MESNSIGAAAAAMQEGQCSPVDVLEACLEHIRRLEDQVHAWVVVDAGPARQRARELERQARAGRLPGPLYGIPVGVKDIVDVRGLPTRAGSRLRAAQAPAGSDATLIARLLDAGAVVLGKTVTTEFACFDPPPTRNPWDLERTPGGSSSGSAAAVALGMCLGAVGTQTGGSIIRPASYCGVAGLKPTFAAVSLEGVLPASERLDHAGPLARCVDDLARLFCAMAEPPALTSTVQEFKAWVRTSGRPDAEGHSAWRLWCCEQAHDRGFPDLRFLEEEFLAAASPDVRNATLHAVERFGPGVDPWRLPPGWLAEVRGNHALIMAAEVARVHEAEYRREPQGFGPNIAALIEKGLAVGSDAYAAALRHLQHTRRTVRELFPGDTLLLLPSTSTAAPGPETTGDPAFNSPWSYAGIPAVTVPCGLSDSGLPCGLQLLGPPQSELRLLRAAAWCEQRLDFCCAPRLLSGSARCALE